MNKNQCIFLVGAPGSGKDFVLRTAFAEQKVYEISLNKLFSAIVEKENIPEIVDNPALVVNGNADDDEKVVVCKAVLEAVGYTTGMIYVYTSDEVSRLRNEARIVNGQKTITEEVRSTKYNSSIKNMHQYKEDFDPAFFMFINNDDFHDLTEERKLTLVSWIQELSENVKQYFGGLEEINTAFESTVLDMELQKKKTKKTPSDGDKYTGGGVAMSSKNRADNVVAEEGQEIEVKQDSKVPGKGTNPKRPKKGATPPSTDYDSRMGAVPSGGIGLTAYKAESVTFENLRKRK